MEGERINLTAGKSPGFIGCIYLVSQGFNSIEYGGNMERIDSNINVDSALDAILKASGSALKNYTLPGNLDRMREAMRKVMIQSYIAGSNACHKAFTGRQ